jgi:predicted membrane channel-forming protein YqfA (hemolysin III family)
MNRLQKNAWIEFGVAVIAALLSVVFITSMVASNVRGITYVIALVVACCVIGPLVASFAYKDESKYDERERMIRRRAFRWATCALILFLILACYVPFFLIGGQGSIPIYYLLIIFWGSLLITQTVHSSVILFQCAKEQDDG